MMGKYRGRLLAAVAACLVGAASLGTGLGGMVVVMQQILGKGGKDLPQLMTALNDKLAQNALAVKLGLQVPASWIAAMPTGAYNAVLWTVIVLGVAAIIGSVANYLH